MEQAGHGHTMVYSTAARAQEELSEARAERRGRAILVAEGKRMPLGPHGGVHRPQPGVRHRARRTRTSRAATPSCGPTAATAGRSTDLGSTNGVKVNGRPVASGRGVAVAPGDHLDIGTVDVRFEVQ